MISRRESFDDGRAGAEQVARCPTCSARRTPERTVCQRCGTDLSMLVHVERRAATLHDHALDHYLAGRFRTALGLVTEAARLRAQDRTLELLAASALRAGDYPAALAAARRRRGSR